MINSLLKNIKQYIDNTMDIVGINSRNLEYVYPNNDRKDYVYADNKLHTKEILSPLGIGISETFFAYEYLFELKNLETDLAKHNGFVIKPARGSGGNGIMVIKKVVGGKFITVSGKELTYEDLKSHISNIIFGIFTSGMSDIAIVEEVLESHEDLLSLNRLGLSDIRIICYKNEIVAGMMRVATTQSDGKANLHQGGIGISINMETGVTENAQVKRKNIRLHPDDGSELIGIKIPDWDQVLSLSQKVSKIMPLNYLGIDVVMSKKGPIILEINARPGIEIQNIREQGLKPMFREFDK